MNTGTLARAFVFFGVLFLSTPATALAYGGPGSVISGIGALVAVLAALAAAILGFIWYPVKKLLRSVHERLRGTAEVGQGASEDATP